MKIVFSRKGLDSASGGGPSPIVGKLPVSLPVPREKTGTKYSDIQVGDLNLGKVVEDLTEGRIPGGSECCCNPELEKVGAFGQSGKPQAHLRRNRIGKGDLFLFFGLFREAAGDAKEGFKFARLSPAHYRLYGWMEVGGSRRLPGQEGEKYARVHPRYRRHPHFIGSWDEGNTVYFPAEHLSFIADEKIPGYGKFRADHPATLLSVGADRPPGTWKMPDWLNPNTGGKGLTFHADSKWGRDTLASASRAQELVADPHPDRIDEMLNWLRALFDGRYLW